MTQPIEESLLKAIKNDDIKAFDALMERNQCGAYRLGRFPTLSLMYLYGARKLISAYEDGFLNITSYKIIGEPMEISGKFSSMAGKCLRLYFNEVVSPLEMLLILDKTRKLKQVFPKINIVSSAIKARLTSIYYIKYSLGVKFEGDGIVLDRRPLSYKEKRKIATVCVCVIFALVIVVGGPITLNAIIPKPIEGEVTNLNGIDFNSDKTYTLKRDIAIPENYKVEKVNCTIVGGGKKLIMGKGASLGELNGKLSDVTVESAGEPLFDRVSGKAVIENATFNVNAAVATQTGTAFVALTNYGTIQNVTLNVGGKIKALASSVEASTELTFGGIVNQNYVMRSQYEQYIGTVKNCVVNYSDFSLVGEAIANAVFGGVVGINNGYLQDCKVNGNITSDTFDIAGICATNNGVLSGDVNQADLLQTSADTGWNPLVCGVVMRNAYAVTNCQNIGKISSTSACDITDLQDELIPTVSAVGIAYINTGEISICKNGGDVSAAGVGEAYVSGIAAQSVSGIYYCISSGAVTAKAKEVYAGGILSLSEVTNVGNTIYFGIVESCISESKINVESTGGKSYVGGIVGYVKEAGFEDGDVTKYFGGVVTGSYFLGEIQAKEAYVGNIVGVSGANIYESNLFVSSDGNERYNFYGNVYVGNSFSAFGATVKDEDDFLAAAENKGASSAAAEEIKNSEGYKNILKRFGTA